MKETKLSKATTRLDIADLATLEYRNTFKHSNFTNSKGELRDGIISKIKAADNINYKQAKNSIANIIDNDNLERTQVNTGIKRTIINNIKYEMVKTIKEEYGNYYAIWLPSTSVHKREEHVEHYGKTFKISDGLKGEFPGEDYGCKCGLQILEENNNFIAADKVQQRGYQENIMPILPIPKISLRNMILVALAGTSFLTHKNNIKQSNKLTKSGITDYKEALAAGGGNLEQRAREVLAGIKLQGKKFNKINAEVKNNILQIHIISQLTKDNKTKLINTTAEININNKDVLIKIDGIYIRQNKQDKLENNTIKELAKKYNTTKLEVISFGSI